MNSSRRTFLVQSAGASGALILGCDSSGSAGGDPVADASDEGGGDAVLADSVTPDPDEGPTDQDEGMPPMDDGPPPDEGPEPEVCADAFAAGTYVGNLGWVGEGTPPMNTPFGQGLDGREYFDLEALTPDNLLTPVESFYIRTRKPDTLDLSQPWSTEVFGLIDEPFTLTWEDIEPLIEPMGNYLLECSGNGAFAHFGMLSVTEWQGVPIQKIFDMVNLKPESTMVRIAGYDDHTQPSANSMKGASWVFHLEDLIAAGAFLGTHMGGEPLTADHGQPVRLYVPRWYGCTCVKWLNEIEFVTDDEKPTGQMVEFASRTHQTNPPPALAKDWRAATQDVAAMPVRVERWTIDGQITFKVVGIIWGGFESVQDKLLVRFARQGEFPPFAPVDVCPDHTQNNFWTLWEHQWTPSAEGDYEISLKVSDTEVPTIRLDIGFYNRVIRVQALG